MIISLILFSTTLSFAEDVKYKLLAQRKKVRVETVLGHKRVVIGHSVVMPANENVAAKVITMVNQGKFFCDVKMEQFHFSSSDGFYMLYGIENCEKEN